MYNWIIRHRQDGGSNLIDPRKLKQGFYWFNDSEGTLSQYAYTEMIPVNPSQTYQARGTGTDNILRTISFYDYNKQFVTDTSFWPLVSTFTVPSGSYYAIITLSSEDAGQPSEGISLSLGVGSAYTPYYTTRSVQAIYKKMGRGYDKQSNYQFYREKLDGNLKLVREDYDYLSALGFDQKILIDVEDTTGILPTYKGQFYKTDCKWDDDDKIVEIKTEPADYYTEVLAGLDKTFNIIQEAPELQEVTLRRRPLIQVYIPGDNVITNILGGTYWEQEIQIDPEFDGATLVNDYKFYNSKNIKNIPAAYASSLSTDVTGEYDANRLNTNGLYRIVEESQNIYFNFYQYRYTVERVSDGVDLYQTAWTTYQKPSINTNVFNGINGQTGSFYFTEYRIYVRYYTDKLDVRGTATYPVPETDIVANNRNYKRVIGYNIDDFYTYDQFVTYPTKFGKVPSEAPNAGEYYKEFLVSVTTGLSNPLPVSSTNWRATSLWFFNDLDIRYTEFIDGQDFTLRDAFPLHSVIQILLRKIGSTVTHNNETEYSEFLYSTTNPLGGFSFLDFEGGTIGTDYSGNLVHFLTPKSNIIAGEYDQPAQKADVTLAQILNMLRDVYKVYWHIENGKLRLEHITWYQKGGTYGANIVGVDLTQLTQTKNNKKWNFSENKWSFDKENMPERFEYGWMDDVSLPFEGKPIQINSNYVQLGRVEDLNVNGVTTDIDYIMGNPQEVSKDGLCLLSAVLINGTYRVPFIQYNIGYNSEVIMQNGFLSWLYLHPKFHVFDLPSDKVNVNGEDTTLFNNNTRQKKQEITYPASQTINPYQLVRTGLGDGLVDKLTIDMESRMIKATIKHDTE